MDLQTNASNKGFDKSAIGRAAYKSYLISAGGRINPVSKEKGLTLAGMMFHPCPLGLLLITNIN